MTTRIEVPRRLRDELDRTGLPWTAEHRSRHLQIKLDGKVVLMLSRCCSESGAGRHIANNLACVRRMARELKERRTK